MNQGASCQPNITGQERKVPEEGGRYFYLLYPWILHKDSFGVQGHEQTDKALKRYTRVTTHLLQTQVTGLPAQG